jgi:isopentenyl-diphosphate delta-isomerase type 1
MHLMNNPEFLDVLDDEGNPLSFVKTRDLVHHDGDWHRTVHVWIINPHHELILQKRSHEKESYPNLWDVSCAGHIAAGQTSIAAAIREVREELGMAIQKKDLVYLFTIKSHFPQHEGAFIDNEINDVFLVEKDLSLSEIHLQKEEVSGIKWISIDNLKEALKSKPWDFAPHKEEYEKLFANTLNL